jgi:2-polyprenyl-3-methyl-5-hydroxy-6-metoxy-1,4-benzoquinol methylase
MNPSTRSIDRYHRNMFDLDEPNSKWVTACAAYLDRLLPGKISGKRIVDYGFGRGNYSLAFLELGASEVVAIDASPRAVERFSGYAKDAGIDNLSVRLGNADEDEINGQADVVFLYGILHHVKRPENLLKTAARMCVDPDSRIVVYSYNSGSLRQTIAEICRSAIGLDTTALGDLSLTLHPDARIRAMDDITAPSVAFWSSLQLQEMLQRAGCTPIAQVADFAAFEGKSNAPEFEPYVLLASPNADVSPIEIKTQASPNASDLSHLRALADLILGDLTGTDRVKLAVGLYNTSFAQQGISQYFERVFNLWRYLVQVALSLGHSFDARRLPPETASLFGATCQRHGIIDIPCPDSAYSHPEASIAAFILGGRFRL